MYSGEALRRMANGGARFGVDGRVCDPPTSAAVTRENVMTDGCGAASGSEWGLKGYPLAMVYAPLQIFVDIYEPEKGLCRGTIFAELDLPLMSAGCRGGGMVRNG